MIKKYRLLSLFLLGFILGSLSGLKIGYNLPRDPTTSINIGKVKTKSGSDLDLNLEATTAPEMTKKQKRKQKRK